MPYLEFSLYHRDEDETSSSSFTERVTQNADETLDATEKRLLHDLKKHNTFLDAYKATAFHAPSTLDDFYYHFTDDSNHEKSMRNKTQVVTKYLYPYGLEGRNYWSLLRVSQLWIWIIDDSEYPTVSRHTLINKCPRVVDLMHVLHNE